MRGKDRSVGSRSQATRKTFRKTDDLALELFPDDRTLNRWLRLARERVHFQGLPARICWLGYGERAEMGEAINDLVKRGDLKAPIAIGRDHLDTGSVASPFRETEGMKDGSDAVADWPILNALLNTASGASWVSFHHGGGVGIGYSLHAGQVSRLRMVRKTGSERLNRVFTNDPGLGVARHVDARVTKKPEDRPRKEINIPLLGAGCLTLPLNVAREAGTLLVNVWSPEDHQQGRHRTRY